MAFKDLDEALNQLGFQKEDAIELDAALRRARRKYDRLRNLDGTKKAKENERARQRRREDPKYVERIKKWRAAQYLKRKAFVHRFILELPHVMKRAIAAQAKREGLSMRAVVLKALQIYLQTRNRT